MKKRFILSSLMIVSMLVFVALYTMNEESFTEKKQYESSKIIMGEIIEIINSNEIKIEIVKERGGYRKGEEVIVRYDAMLVELLNEDTGMNDEYQKINIGDIISVKIVLECETKGGVDYYSVPEIVKMIY